MDSIAHEILPYLTTIIGFLIVYVLNGIKSEIKEVKTGVAGLERDIRDSLSGLDHRLTKVETTCRFYHKEDE